MSKASARPRAQLAQSFPRPDAIHANLYCKFLVCLPITSVNTPGDNVSDPTGPEHRPGQLTTARIPGGVRL
jgi:hypothetical protein